MSRERLPRPIATGRVTRALEASVRRVPCSTGAATARGDRLGGDGVYRLGYLYLLVAFMLLVTAMLPLLLILTAIYAFGLLMAVFL